MNLNHSDFKGLLSSRLRIVKGPLSNCTKLKAFIPIISVTMRLFLLTIHVLCLFVLYFDLDDVMINCKSI